MRQEQIDRRPAKRVAARRKAALAAATDAVTVPAAEVDDTTDRVLARIDEVLDAA